MFDFMWIQVFGVVLVLVFPSIAMWLPEALQAEPAMAVPPLPDGDALTPQSLEAGDSISPVEPDDGETAPAQ